MSELMRRQRALMGAKEEQGETVPGRIVEIPQAFTTASELKTIVAGVIASNQINCPAIMITTRKMHQLISTEFVVAIVQASGAVSVAWRYYGGKVVTYNTWGDFNFVCSAGTKFYILESQPSENSEQIPGCTVPMTQQITNGANLRTVVQESLSLHGITRYSIMMTAKPKTSWDNRKFVCATVENNGLAYSAGNFGPCRWNSSTKALESRNTTTTYDFKASASDEYYVVEVQP